MSLGYLDDPAFLALREDVVTQGISLNAIYSAVRDPKHKTKKLTVNQSVDVEMMPGPGKSNSIQNDKAGEEAMSVKVTLLKRTRFKLRLENKSVLIGFRNNRRYNCDFNLSQIRGQSQHGSLIATPLRATSAFNARESVTPK
jgi:hypothetical protein